MVISLTANTNNFTFKISFSSSKLITLLCLQANYLTSLRPLINYTNTLNDQSPPSCLPFLFLQNGFYILSLYPLLFNQACSSSQYQMYQPMCQCNVLLSAVIVNLLTSKVNYATQCVSQVIFSHLL